MNDLNTHFYPKNYVKYYHNKKVLVTGGAGFIGSHLVEALVAAGAQVTVLDNLSTGSLENLTTVLDKITFVQADITDSAACTKASRNIEYIFHLAAFISVPESYKDPEACHASNITGTFNMLEAARINQVQQFVFSSSCAVYGDYQEVATENSPTLPTSPYGYSKLLGEMYCKSYWQLHQMPTTILRYYNVVGPRQNPVGDYAGVYAKFSYNMQNNLPITIFGNGQQVRDFVPVQEVVRANLLAAVIPEKAHLQTIINVGTGKAISIFQLYTALKKNYPNYKLEPIFKEQRPGDIEYSLGDCTRYQQLQKQV